MTTRWHLLLLPQMLNMLFSLTGVDLSLFYDMPDIFRHNLTQTTRFLYFLKQSFIIVFDTWYLINFKFGGKLQREPRRLIDSYTKRSMHDCLTRSPLTSPNTMHKYLPAFPWIATQCFCHWIMILEHITHSLGKVRALLCLRGVPSTKDPTLMCRQQG